MSTYETIKDAIENLKQIHASYGGYHREMCPHVLGEKNGKMSCLFYQFGGESSSGKIEQESKQNWRCLAIDRLKDVSSVEGQWHTADNHSSGQTCVDEIHAIIDY